MGNNNTLLTAPGVNRRSQPGEWTKQGTTGYSDIIRNNQTGQLAQQYTIPIDRRINRTEDIRRYEFRRTQNLNLVRVLQVENENSQYICQGQDFQCVKTEYIPKRLSEINNLSDIQGLFVLQQALIGYKTIHQFQGALTINDEMIGFTPEGQVRVWLNENFARNLPDIQNIAVSKINQEAYKPQNQTVLIDQIYDIVEAHVVGQHFPEKFHDAYTQNPPKTFREAIDIVKGYFANLHVTIPQGITIGNYGQSTIQPVIQSAIQPAIQSTTQSVIQSTSVEQQPILPPQIISLGGKQTQLVTNSPPPSRIIPRSVSVGHLGGSQSQLILSKPLTSALMTSGYGPSLIPKPNTSLTLSQIRMPYQNPPVFNPSISLNDMRRQQWNPSKPIVNLPIRSIMDTLGVKATPQSHHVSGRPTINFRAPLTPTGITSSTQHSSVHNTGEHLQFTRKAPTKSVNSSLPGGFLSNIVNFNAKYLNTSIKDSVQVNSSLGATRQEAKVTTTTATTTTTPPSSNNYSLQQGKLLTDALNIDVNAKTTVGQSDKINTVKANLNRLIERKPELQTKESGPKILRYAQYNSQQPTAQTTQKASQPTQKITFTPQNLINQATSNIPIKKQIPSTIVKQIDITTAPRVIKLNETQVISPEKKHTTSSNQHENNLTGQRMLGSNYKFQQVPSSSQRANVIRTQDTRFHNQTQPHSRVQPQQIRRIPVSVTQQQPQQLTQNTDCVVIVEEMTLTQNERGVLEAHEQIVATEIDELGNAFSSGYVADYTTGEHDIVGGVTYSTAQITDYTVGEDSAGHPYITSHTYDYTPSNPVREYESYIDSSTGVDGLESFRVGEQRNYVPQDYQQIVQNKLYDVPYGNYTSGTTTTPSSAIGSTNVYQSSNASSHPNTPTYYVNSSSSHPGYSRQDGSLPSYSELSKKLITPPAAYIPTNAQSFSNNKTTFSFEAPGPVRRPVPVAVGLVD